MKIEFSENVYEWFKLMFTGMQGISLPFPFNMSDGPIGRVINKSPYNVPPSVFPFRGVPIGGGVFLAWFWNILDSVTLWIVTWEVKMII